jgi:lipopolysaccharide export system protein LptA
MLTALWDDAEAQTADDSKEKIRISANTLISDPEAKYAEFIGNVSVTQGNTMITSDKLRIFYKEKSDDKASGEDLIKKIVARGNVKIKFDNKVAESDEAVYTTEDRVLVLSGEESKVLDGNNSVSGSKITLYRTDGRIKVEGSGEKPVEAVLYPGGKGIE